MIVIRKIMVRPADLTPRHAGYDDRTDVEQYRVVNPALEGRTLGEVVRFTRARFIISRIWRNGRVIMPLGKTVLHIGDEIQTPWCFSSVSMWRKTGTANG